MSLLQIARRTSLAAATCRRYSSTVSSGTTPGSGDSAAAKKPGQAAPKSSCPPETVLKGLNYLKGQPPVLALPDDQYPDWLWTVLSPKQYPDDGPGGKAERVARKKERQQAIKDRNFMSTQ